jgi:hypothetical protein
MLDADSTITEIVPGSTATSWRSASSSMSLDEVVRLNRVSQLRSWPKIR